MTKIEELKEQIKDEKRKVREQKKSKNKAKCPYTLELIECCATFIWLIFWAAWGLLGIFLSDLNKQTSVFKLLILGALMIDICFIVAAVKCYDAMNKDIEKIKDWKMKNKQ